MVGRNELVNRKRAELPSRGLRDRSRPCPNGHGSKRPSDRAKTRRVGTRKMRDAADSGDAGRRGHSLWLAHGDGGARQSGAPHPQAAASTENALRRLADDSIAPPRRARTGAAGRAGGAADARRRASGSARRGRSPALARHRGPAGDRHRAGARPDHRSAQCRRHFAHRGGVRGHGDRHHGAAQPGSDRRAGEIRLRRARTGADRDRAKSGARARRAEGTRLSGRRSRQRARRTISPRSSCARRSRWCSAPKARACGN